MSLKALSPMPQVVSRYTKTLVVIRWVPEEPRSPCEPIFTYCLNVYDASYVTGYNILRGFTLHPRTSPFDYQISER